MFRNLARGSRVLRTNHNVLKRTATQNANSGADVAPKVILGLAAAAAIAFGTGDRKSAGQPTATKVQREGRGLDISEIEKKVLTPEQIDAQKAVEVVEEPKVTEVIEEPVVEEAAAEVIEEVVEVTEEVTEVVAEEIQETVAEPEVAEVIEEPVAEIVEAVTEVVETVTEVVEEVSEVVEAVAEAVVEAVEDVAPKEEIVEEVVETVTEAVAEIVEEVSSAAEEIVAVVSEVVEAAPEPVVEEVVETPAPVAETSSCCCKETPAETTETTETIVEPSAVEEPVVVEQVAVEPVAAEPVEAEPVVTETAVIEEAPVEISEPVIETEVVEKVEDSLISLEASIEQTEELLANELQSSPEVTEVPLTQLEPQLETVIETVPEVAENVPENVTELIAEPVAEIIAEPTEEAVTESITAVVTEPIVEPVSESEPVAEVVEPVIATDVTNEVSLEAMVEVVSDTIEVVQEVVEEMTPVIEEVTEKVTEVIAETSETVETIATEIVDVVTEIAENKEEVIKTVVENVPIIADAVETVVETVSETISDAAVEVAETVVEAVAEVVDEVSSVVEEVSTVVETESAVVVDAVVETVVDTISEITESSPEVPEPVVEPSEVDAEVKSGVQTESTTPEVEEVVPAEAVVHEYPEIPPEVPYLIVGGGTAAYAAVRAIRKYDPAAKILILSSESQAPYNRTPLSKEMWFTNDGNVRNLSYEDFRGKERSIFHEKYDFYCTTRELQAREDYGGTALLLGATLDKLDPNDKVAILTNGSEIKYDKCLLAIGGKPKSLDVIEKSESSIKENVTMFRDVNDFWKLESLSRRPGDLVIIGSGFLGAELAYALGERSKENPELKVSQICRESGVLGAVLPRHLSDYASEAIEQSGVNVVRNAEIESVTKNEKIEINLTDGRKVPADHVVLAVGVDIDTSIAKKSGLEYDPHRGGFIVNSELESRRDVYVAGDAANFFDIRLGRRRVEHYDHAIVTGRLAGENMTGKRKAYSHQSMFWSDIGSNIGFEAMGLVDSRLKSVSVFAQQDNVDVVKNDDVNKNKYDKGVVFYLRNEVIVGVVTWNIFGKMGVARRLIAMESTEKDYAELAKLFNVNKI